MDEPPPGVPGRRFPAGLYADGDEPDPRFTLANERTFLAWLRTSLALTAAGVGLEALGVGLQPQLRLAASLLLIAAGMATAVQSWRGWLRTEGSLRRQLPLPAPALALPAAATLVVVGVLVLLAIALR
jgi:putative membrane protein